MIRRRRKPVGKYNNIRTVRNGLSFMSKGEADCYSYLLLLQRAGEIVGLQTQVIVRLTEANIKWVLDFTYLERKTGFFIYADFKGFETHRWKLLKQLWPVYGPGRLKVYKGSGLRMRVVEELIPRIK